MAKVDSLEIELKSNAKKIASDFDTLRKSVSGVDPSNLNEVSKITKSLAKSTKDEKAFEDGLKKISASLNVFVQSINRLDTSKFDSLATKLEKISKIDTKKIESVGKSIKKIDDSAKDASGLKKSKQSVDEFMASIKGLGKNQKFFGSSSQLETEIASTQNKIEKIRTSLEAYNQEGKSVETKGWRTAQRQLEQYTNYLDNLLEKQRQLSSGNGGGFKFDEKAIAGSKENIYKLLVSDEEYEKMRQDIIAKGIKVPVEFDVEELEDDLDSKISNLGSNMFANINTSGFDKAKEKVVEVDNKVNSLAQKMRSDLMFEPTQLGKNQRYSKEYIRLEKEIQKAEKELEKFLNTQERLNESGVKTSTQRYKNVEMSIRDADKRLQQLNADMKNLQSSGADVVNVSQFERLSESASKAQGIMQVLAKGLRGVGLGSAASSVQSLSANVGSMSAGLSEASTAATGATGALAGLSTAVPIIALIVAGIMSVVKVFTLLARIAVNSIKKVVNAIKGLLTKIKDIATGILTIGTSSYKGTTAVGKFVNKIIGLFKSRVLRQAITQAIQYVKDGFKSLDVYSANIGSPFHNNVLTIIADLKLLGRTIATAFEPIVNVAFPILDFLIGKIITVINYINQFISALTGSNTWTKATLGASDFSNAASGAAKAQKDLNKQIREWDKLNVITDPNKGNGGAGGGSSAVSGDGFITEEVPNSIKNLATKFKETWETTADFTWLGESIGTKVKEVLDGIPWEEKIKPSASKFGTALATTINGFVKVEGLSDTIGTTIAQAINTALTTFDSFTKNIDGNAVGSFIGDTIKTALSKIEWNKYITGMGNLGKALADGINGIADTDVLSEISKSFAKIIKGAIEGAYQFITNLDFKKVGEKIGQAITDFFDEMNKVGEDGKTGWVKLGLTVKGVVEGIEDLFTNLKDNIDMSKVAEGLGQFLGAVIDPEEVKKKIKEKLQEGLLKLATGDFILPFSLYDLLTLGKDEDSPKAKIESAIETAKNWLKTNLLEIGAKIPDIKAAIEEKLKNVKDTAVNIALNVSDKVSGVVEKLKTDWQNLKFKKKEMTAKLKGGAQDAIAKLKNAWSNLKSGTKNFTTNIKGTAYNALVKIKAVWDSFSTKAKTITLNFIDNFTSPLKRAWNGLANSINSFSAKISDKIPKLPTFAGYATGGFPEDGWFRASHGEYFGKFDNGQSVIANNKQIENGLMNTVRAGNSELTMLMAQELQETRKQNEYLRQLLAKDTSISYKDVFRATQKGASEYKTVTGNPAFI